MLGRRQALGLLTAALVLAAGRGIRQALLVGPDGAWRQELWLDAQLEPAATDGAAPAPLPVGESMTALPPEPAPGPAAAPAGAPAGRPAGRARERRTAAAGTLPAGTRIDINRAPQDSLQILPGVGPVLAARIAETRAAGTVFRRPEDLLAVKGIGPVAMARLAPLLQFAAPAPAPVDADNPH